MGHGRGELNFLGRNMSITRLIPLPPMAAPDFSHEAMRNDVSGFRLGGSHAPNQNAMQTNSSVQTRTGSSSPKLADRYKSAEMFNMFSLHSDPLMYGQHASMNMSACRAVRTQLGLVSNAN